MSCGHQDGADRPDDESTPITGAQLALANSLRGHFEGVPGAGPFLQRWRFLEDNSPASCRLFRHERTQQQHRILMGDPVQLWSTYCSSYRPEVSIRAVEITRSPTCRLPLALRIFRYGPGRRNHARASDLVLLQHLSWTCDNTTRCHVFTGEGRVETRFPDYTVSLRDLPRGSRLLYVISPDVVEDQEPGGAVFDPSCIGQPAPLRRLRIIFSVPYTRRGRQEAGAVRDVGPWP